MYTIVLFENSPEEFRAYSGTYLHWFEQKSDTGLEMNLLQKYLFIPLDIFGEKIHNEGVSNETEAWLAFLSQDDPVIVAHLIEKYPEFRAMYEEVYRICRNMEDVMKIFSDELRILDENTVMNMIDEMKEENEQMRAELERRGEKIALLESQSREDRRHYEEMERQVEELRQRLASQSRNTV